MSEFSPPPLSPVTPRGTSKRIELKASDFYFGKTLGEGSYARVLHAKMKSHIKSSNQEYAIKIMEKEYIKRENKVKNIMMEKTILSKISHPFIVKFFYSFHDDEYLYMVMDLAPGGILLNLIEIQTEKNEKLGITNVACDLSMTRFYMAQVIEALEYLHSINIIHRDLKPETNGHIKVADFGSAVIMTDEEEVARNSFVGTAEYVSPEVLLNEALSLGCDLWALGCMIYQMLSGIVPFRGASEYLTFQIIIDHYNGVKPLEFVSSIPTVASDIISKLLIKDSSKRLGAENYAALKTHEFFESMVWGDDLFQFKSPYIPDPSTFPDSTNMRDGAAEDWNLEYEDCEAISLEVTPSILPSHSEDHDNRLTERGSMSHSLFGRGTNFLTNLGITPGNNSSADVSKFLKPEENSVFSGIIVKKPGKSMGLSQRRQLILSDQPRLIYIDPDSLEFKGEIPWTLQKPVKCGMIDDSSFFILSTVTGRKYYISAPDSGSQMWVDLINAMLQYQQEIFKSGVV